MSRTAERIGLLAVAPFYILAFVFAGSIAGPVLGVWEAIQDLRLEWRS